tara:strand:+ start:2069 stop:2527 length:459 start_codon:yes stop_codon:yes gene_type:complete
MSRNITLDNNKLKKIISDIFDKRYKDTALVDALVNMLGDSSLDMLIHIMFEPDYELLEIGDYVKFKPSKYDFDIDRDIMIDKGVMKNGYMYGEVLKDTSYNDDFNPTYYKMLLNVITLNDDGTVIRQDHEVKTIEITKIDKSEIKYLNYEKV